MKTYNRSIWLLVKGIISAPLGAVVVFFGLNAFFTNVYVVYGIPLAVLLIIWYISIFSENIRFVVTDDGVFRYYKGLRLKKEYQLKDCYVGYRRVSETGVLADHDLQLQILDTKDPNSNDDHIDCSPIGPRKFEKMFAHLQQFALENNDVIKATPR